MDGLQVAAGGAARALLCDAFANARCSIDAEYFSISDPSVVASLNAAAARGVRVHLHVEAHPNRYQKPPVDAIRSKHALQAKLARTFSKKVQVELEDDPAVLMHAKAAVVDGATAYFGTANPTWSSFENPGAVVVKDSQPADVAAVEQNIEHGVSAVSERVVAGPCAVMHERVDALLSSAHDLSIASEDLSDPEVVRRLVARRTQGRHDRVLVGDRGSVAQRQAVTWLEHSGVDVHRLSHGFMHEKYIDDGEAFYVGSANLTRNGLDESREVVIFGNSAGAPEGASTLRADFDQDWSNSVPM